MGKGMPATSMTAPTTNDSEIKVPFLKPKAGKYTIRIEGTAFYDKGRSSKSIKPEPSTDLNIKINSNSFVTAN